MRDETCLCGEISVPEHWCASNGRSIPVSYVVLRSVGLAQFAGPMIFFQGGRGRSTLNSLAQIGSGAKALRNNVVVILFAVPGGIQRVVFFREGAFASTGASQALDEFDTFAGKTANLNTILIDDERHENPDAVIFNGCRRHLNTQTPRRTLMPNSKFLSATAGAVALLTFTGGATQAADVSQDAIDACIDALRAQNGGGGGTVVSTEFSQANSMVVLQDSAGSRWNCLVSNSGQNPELSAASGSSDGGGAQAGSGGNVTGEVRVQFAPGASGARYGNQLGSGEAVTYVLNAREGQFLTVDLQGATPNLDYIIYSAGGDILDQASQSSFMYSGQLYESGDHRVEVFYNGNQGTYAEFTIDFEIQ